MCACARVHVCACMCVHTCVHTCVSVCVYMHCVFVCVNACVRAPSLWEGEVEGANCTARAFNYRVLKGGS